MEKLEDTSFFAELVLNDLQAFYNTCTYILDPCTVVSIEF